METTIKPQTKWLQVAILSLAMLGLSNCNQFASFSGSEEDAFLSENPVFANPVDSNIGSDPFDDGFTLAPPNTNPPTDNPITTNPVNPKNPVVTPPTTTNLPPTITVDPPTTTTNPPTTTTNPPTTTTNPPTTTTNPPTVTTPLPRPDVTPTPRPRFNGGDGGGDGGGDPLMIDTVGVEYTRDQLKQASQQLRNSNDSYFRSGDLNLSSPEQGTRFNLLGQQTHARLDDDFLHINEAGKNFEYQISWIQADQTRYQFLVLPDANGNVLGVDQLFGDNTFGPSDSRPFATDGFEALRKWDRGDSGNQGNFFDDGFIDANDAIFSKLRLWHDKNRNGKVATAEERQSELISLHEAGIASIHLQVNRNFTERDKYQNVIMYKALVHFSSKGDKIRLGTAFDMWFRYNPEILIEKGGAARIPQQ